MSKRLVGGIIPVGCKYKTSSWHLIVAACIFFRRSFPCNSEEACFKGRGAWENRTRRIDSEGNFDCGAYWNRLGRGHIIYSGV